MEQQPLSFNAQKQTRRCLTQRESFSLAGFVLSEYTKSGLTDAEFAMKASEFLNIPGLNDKHIFSSRKIHDIPSNKAVKAAAKPKSPKTTGKEDRLLGIELQLNHIASLLEGKGKADPSYHHEEPITADELLSTWRRAIRRYAPGHPPPDDVPVWVFQFALAILRGEWK